MNKKSGYNYFYCFLIVYYKFLGTKCCCSEVMNSKITRRVNVYLLVYDYIKVTKCWGTS